MRVIHLLAPLGVVTSDHRVLAVDCEISLRAQIVPVFSPDGKELVGALTQVGTRGHGDWLWGQLDLTPEDAARLAAPTDEQGYEIAIDFSDYRADLRAEGGPLVFERAVIGAARLIPRTQWPWHTTARVVRHDDPEFVGKVVAGLLGSHGDDIDWSQVRRVQPHEFGTQGTDIPVEIVAIDRTERLDLAAIGRYREALAAGLSDHEAREDGWPTTECDPNRGD